MEHYKLTEQEARELATKIAYSENTYSQDCDLEDWISKYMEKYDEIMNVINRYNQLSGN